MFLTSRLVPDESFVIALESDPGECLRLGGLASPIFGAFESSLPTLDENGTLTLCFPKSPRELLFRAQEHLSPNQRAGFFVSHGLASVGFMLGSGSDPNETLKPLGEMVTGYQIWPFRDSIVRRGEIFVAEPVSSADEPRVNIDPVGCPYEVAAQIRQFNANMTALLPRVRRYAPEFLVLFEWLIRSAQTAVAEVLRVLSETVDVDAIQIVNYAAANLVEVNAGLTMLDSQLLSGTHPLDRDYPVAEYSLLGIGGVTRGLWGLYLQLSKAFAQADNPTRMTDSYETGDEFPTLLNRQDGSLSDWANAKVRLENLPLHAGTGGETRLHVLHFSSRYGFHESLNTMSASWQCVFSSACRDWNLLTLSHEFLHAHVREILALVFDRFEPEEIVEILRVDQPTSAWESAAGALVAAMHHTWWVRRDLPQLSIDRPVYISPAWTSEPSVEEVELFLDGEMRRYLQEILVHTLDYLYTYDGRDELYIASIWSSWTFVPVVAKRLHHYIVRSLTSLASLDASPMVEKEAFFDAMKRLKDVFAVLVAEAPNPVVSRASEMLDNPQDRLKLEAEFSQAYYFARFAREFLFDRRIGAILSADSGTRVGDDGYPTYDVSVGTYPGQRVESPVSFLIERFSTYEHTLADESVGRESLWQILLLTTESMT